jgi:hypothetical protein
MTEFVLQPLKLGDATALQMVYNKAPATFTRLLGRPAGPGQAARDLAQASTTPGRYQFGAVLDGELVGMVDLKLGDDVPGQAHLGLLVLAEPFADEVLASLMVRMLSRWLVTACAVNRLEVSVPAQHAPDIIFWQSLGFTFTGQQYRRQLVDYAPRFLVLARDLTLEGG